MKPIKILSHKVHVFDVVIGLFIIVSILIFFFFFYRKASFITIRVKVTDQDILYANTTPKTWYASRFEVGDTELDTFGEKQSEIIGIERFNTTAMEQITYLDLKVNAIYDSRTKSYSYRGKKMIFGMPIRINLSKITFDGIITEFPGSDINHSIKIGKTSITGLIRFVEPSVAQAITSGSTVSDTNNMLMEIIDVKIQPAQQVTTTYTGDLVLKYNPLYKDVIVTAVVQTKTVGGETYIFDTIPLKIGQFFPLILDNVAIDKTMLNPKSNSYPIITAFSVENH